MTPTTAPLRMPSWLEQAWLARYLDRELDGMEAAWFEAYVLDRPELLGMIEADTRMRDALAADASVGRRDAPSASFTDQSNTAAMAPSSAQVIQSSSFQRGLEPSSSNSNSRTRGAAPRWFALAAALVLGLGAGGIAMRMFAPQRDMDLVASPTRIIYDTMRGEAVPPRVEHADSASPLVLIEVAVPPGAQNITLHVDSKPDQPLAPSPDGFVSFLLAREMMQQHRLPSVSYALADGSGKHSIDLEVPQG